MYEHIEKLVNSDETNADACLVIDAMNIKKSVVFNKEKGCYEGFTNYGENIICDSPDEIASEALVFI